MKPLQTPQRPVWESNPQPFSPKPLLQFHSVRERVKADLSKGTAAQDKEMKRFEYDTDGLQTDMTLTDRFKDETQNITSKQQHHKKKEQRAQCYLSLIYSFKNERL